MCLGRAVTLRYITTYIPPSLFLKIHKHQLSTGAMQPPAKRNFVRRTDGAPSNPPTKVLMKSRNELKGIVEDAARRIAATEQLHDIALVASYWKAVGGTSPPFCHTPLGSRANSTSLRMPAYYRPHYRPNHK